MSDQNVPTSRQSRQETGLPGGKPPGYGVTRTEQGRWLHATGPDFLFAYIEEDWPQDLVVAVTRTFEDRLNFSATIKTAVKTTSGQDVANGLYLLDQAAMTEAMNSIDGMSQTGANPVSQQGQGTAQHITAQFFQAVLAGLGGDVFPLLGYLTMQMGDIQGQAKRSVATENFGIVVGLVSAVPGFGMPVAAYRYVYSTPEVADWFVGVPCGSTASQSYDYGFTIVDYACRAPSA